MKIPISLLNVLLLRFWFMIFDIWFCIQILILRYTFIEKKSTIFCSIWIISANTIKLWLFFCAECTRIDLWGSGDRRTKREPIPYICDFSRGGLNTRLSARIQTLLRGHRYRGYFLWGFCLFRSGKFIKRFGEEDRRMSLPGKLNFEGLTQKSIRKNYYFYTLK